jgi:hypothetical protein
VSSRDELEIGEEQSLHNSIGKKSAATMESKETWSDAGLSAQLPASRSAQSDKRLEDRTASVSRASKASSVFTPSDCPDKVSSEQRPGFSLPPKQITTHEKTLTAPELDAVSVVSDGSDHEMEDTDKVSEMEALGHPSSASQTRPRRRTGRPPARTKSKSSALSAHLRKQKKEQKKRDKRKQVSRHGDEISLGTVGMRSQAPVEATKEEVPPSQDSGHFEGNNGATAPKSVRPWQDAMPTRKHQYFDSSRADSNHKTKEVTKSKDFFEDHKHVFDRSIFNFNTSFSSKMGGDSFAKSRGDLSAVAEDQSERSEQAKDEDEDDEAAAEGTDEQQMDSYVSIGYEAEQSFIILGYDGIESKLAGKTRDKEEEFNDAWDTIEADKAVAAQMNQRRMMRLREKASGREKKKDEGVVDIPRLFLFEGEKVKKKKKNISRRKERVLPHTTAPEDSSAGTILYVWMIRMVLCRSISWFLAGGKGTQASRRISCP